MTELIALLFKIAGVAFLVLATLGVLRFADPFQRMHAATKAGTVGAGLVLVGTVIAKGSPDAAAVALLTLVLLIATMPVAGHLLGRAAYVSGATLSARTDALAGILPRAALPLELRETSGLEKSDRTDTKPEAPLAAVGDRPDEPDECLGEAGYAQGFDTLRFAIIAASARLVAERARKLGTQADRPLHGLAVIDRACFEAARVAEPQEAIQASLAAGLLDIRDTLDGVRQPVTLSYEIGDPMTLIPSPRSHARELLLLPTDGWFHHDAATTLPVFEDRWADRLFALAQMHHGPTLFVGEAEPQPGNIVILHDGSDYLQRLAAWSLASRIWKARRVHVAGTPRPGQVEDLAALAADHGAGVTRLPENTGGLRSVLPAYLADSAGIVMPHAKLPKRVNAYRVFWQDRIAPGFRGDVLV